MITASSLSQRMTESSFYVRALSEFVERRKQAWEDLIAFLTMLVEQADFDGDEDGVPVVPDSNAIRAEVQATVATAGLNPSAQVLLDDGYVTLEDLAISVLSAAYNNQDGTDEAPLLANGAPLKLVTPAGAQNDAPPLHLLGEQLQSALHAVAALAAATSAQVAGSSVSEKLSIFRDKMANTFQDAYDDVSGVSEYYTSMLSANMSDADFAVGVDRSLQLSEFAADESALTPSTSDVMSITGASPAGPLCFDNYRNAASTVVNIGAKVVAGIVGAVAAAGVALFRKTVAAVSRVTTNPYDLKKLEDPGDGLTVDGWCFASSNDNTGDSYPHQVDIPLGTLGVIDPSVLSALFNGAVKKGAHRWMTVFGDFSFQLTGSGFKYTQQTDGRYSTDGWRLPLEYQFYPRSLKAQYANELSEAYNALSGEINPPNPQGGEGLLTAVKASESEGLRKLDQALLHIRAAGSSAYYTPDDPEIAVAAGFRNAVWFAGLVARIITALRVTGSINGEAYISGQVLKDTTWLGAVPSQYEQPSTDASYWATFKSTSLQSAITNVDLLTVSAGYLGGDWRSDRLADSFYPQYGAVYGNTRTGLAYLAAPVLFSYLDEEYSTSLDAFYPFCLNDPVNPRPTYRIATDGENAEAFNAFVTTAIVLTSVVVLGSALKFAVRKVSNARTLRRLRTQQVATAKNLFGEKLSRRERRALLGAQAKASMASSLNGKTRAKSIASSMANMAGYGAAPSDPAEVTTPVLEAVGSVAEDVTTPVLSAVDRIPTATSNPIIAEMRRFATP